MMAFKAGALKAKGRYAKARRSVGTTALMLSKDVKRLCVFVLGRPGNDLLSRVLRHSTIGAEEFNGRVRDGIGFFSSSLKSPDRRRTNSRQGRKVRPPDLFSVRG